MPAGATTRDLASWLGDRRGSAVRHGDPADLGRRHAVSTVRATSTRRSRCCTSTPTTCSSTSLTRPARPATTTSGPSTSRSLQLAWSEGFANGFAAIAQGSPELTLGCEVRMNVGTKPATARFGGGRSRCGSCPRPAMLIWRSTTRRRSLGRSGRSSSGLGSGDPEAAWKEYLHALKAFADKYHAPRDMREVRDAMTEFADNADRDRPAEDRRRLRRPPAALGLQRLRDQPGEEREWQRLGDPVGLRVVLRHAAARPTIGPVTRTAEGVLSSVRRARTATASGTTTAGSRSAVRSPTPTTTSAGERSGAHGSPIRQRRSSTTATRARCPSCGTRHTARASPRSGWSSSARAVRRSALGRAAT